MASPDSAVPGSKTFEPYIPSETRIPEFTVRSVLTGTILGMVFGASSLYLVLKVGLTVSASIPVAVISLALFRALSKLGIRDATILENNIAQTAGSAGESIAFGIGVTMPAILILGFELELMRVMLVAILGGLLGILMMIPLRRALIVKEHGVLKYPEGTACAAVLTAGASVESRAAASPAARADMAAAEAAGLGSSAGGKVIFTGFGVGLLYKTINIAFKGWKDIPSKVFGSSFQGGSVGIEISPELLGVGYIIGPRIAAIMCAGGVLAYLVLIPMIAFFGGTLGAPLPPGRTLISGMDPDQIREAYILYIGAGAVAAGGIISVIRSLPTIWHGLRAGLGDFRAAQRDRGPSSGAAVGRTDRDLSMKFVGIGLVLLMLAIVLAPSLHMNVLGAILIVIFGFLFVTVSSRLTGEIGSSSNPISGMTIATLLLTCLIFLVIGWTGGTYYVTALSVGAIVCIASSNGGTTSQDLKTGFLVGGTPKLQQYAILFGALASALVLGPILLVLNNTATVYVPIAQVAPGLHTDAAKLTGTSKLTGPQASGDAATYKVWFKTDELGGPAGKYFVNDRGEAVWYVDPGINGTHTKRPDGSEVRKFAAPKATLVSYIIKGILSRDLPWSLVLLGVFIAVTLEMSGIPSLAFAVGVYLPLSTSAPIFVGGLVRWLVDRKKRHQLKDSDLDEHQLAAESDKSPGVLLSSGYIAGGAIAGIFIAISAGLLSGFDTKLNNWANANNPFFGGANADALSVVPFLVLTGFLYFVAREKLLSAPKR
ncbi:oligopeptide transporter, OPT family [Opitutaceae bacterium EW11]|nr:oligopeptide transporter, OPT family [Opitutaceae bacterium EW11]